MDVGMNNSWFYIDNRQIHRVPRLISLGSLEHPAHAPHSLRCRFRCYSFSSTTFVPSKSPEPNIAIATCTIRIPDVSISPSRRIGSYGYAHVSTPHLDQFARQSVRFTRAYAQWPVCAPSRASLFTSRLPDDLGMSCWGESPGTLPGTCAPGDDCR